MFTSLKIGPCSQLEIYSSMKKRKKKKKSNDMQLSIAELVARRAKIITAGYRLDS